MASALASVAAAPVTVSCAGDPYDEGSDTTIAQEAAAGGGFIEEVEDGCIRHGVDSDCV